MTWHTLIMYLAFVAPKQNLWDNVIAHCIIDVFKFNDNNIKDSELLRSFAWNDC